MARQGTTNKRKRDKSLKVLRALGGTLELELTSLEIASGYDGLLRGAPDPVVVLAVYALGSIEPGAHTAPRTVLRHVFRVQLEFMRMPVTVAIPRAAREVIRATNIEDDQLLLVAAGIEDDGGDGAARVFALLEGAEHIAIASHDGADVEALGSFNVAGPTWTVPRRALVLAAGRPIGAAVLQDDWVGACATLIPRARRQTQHRMHLVSEDGKNDWTAVVTTRVRM